MHSVHMPQSVLSFRSAAHKPQGQAQPLALPSRHVWTLQESQTPLSTTRSASLPDLPYRPMNPVTGHK